VIASGEKVIADPAIRDEIASADRKILALEMEGYGVGSAVWHSPEQIRWLVIPALYDRADSAKNDNWHAYAAAVAAGYTRHFLFDRPLEPRNSSKSMPNELYSLVSFKLIALGDLQEKRFTLSVKRLGLNLSQQLKKIL
jgi:hypothetical protein